MKKKKKKPTYGDPEVDMQVAAWRKAHDQFIKMISERPIWQPRNGSDRTKV